jgi:secreted trypsin-like serine protease
MFTKYFLLSIILLAPQMHAIVVSGSNPGDYLSSQTAVGFSNVPSAGQCSGSLLASGQHFLTAAHCILGYSGPASVTFSNSAGTNFTYTSSSMLAHPDFKPGIFELGNDIAIITLSQIVDASINRLSLYSGAGNELGKVATIIGYGRTGTGATGGEAGTFGTRRQGENEIDQISGNLMFMDFDSGLAANNAIAGSSLGRGLAEVFISFGDSGGPVLINGQIAGINSFLTCSSPTFTCGTAIDVNSTLEGSFGEMAGFTRVSTYLTWINQNTGLQNTFEGEVPEPSTLVAVFLGLALCIARARKSSRL